MRLWNLNNKEKYTKAEIDAY